jgi:DNA-binding CsgD family transcriptional regulator
MLPVTTIRNARHALDEGHIATVKRRALPGVFVVDRHLRVVHFNDDPSERRRACRAGITTQSLPAAMREALEEMKVQTADDLPHVWVVPDAALIVRTIPLHSFDGTEPLTTLIVERFSPRNYVRTLSARYGLSARENDVLQLLLRGATNDDIAASLQIAPSTAIFHVKRLMAKTAARNRTELVARATE